MKKRLLIGVFAVVALAMLVPPRPSAAEDFPLIDAAKSRSIEAVSALLKTHADVNGRQRDGATALHWAAHFDDTAMAELLHEKYSVPGWWSQMVTVGYEQARGLRVKHQKKSGFEISATRTIDRTPSYSAPPGRPGR